MSKYQSLSPEERNAKLVDAAEKGHASVVQLLIKAGVDVNASKTYHHLDDMCDTEISLLEWMVPGCRAPARIEKFNLGERSHVTALMLAAHQGHEKCVNLLLEAGADVNAANNWNRTALMKASCKTESMKCLNLLIKAGADVNLTDKVGLTALSYLISCSNKEGTDLLIKSGADVNLSDSDDPTPLMVAARYCATECISSLIEVGVNVNGPPGEDINALSCAAFGPNHKGVQLLLKLGAHIKTDDNVSEGLLLHYMWRKHYNEKILLLLFAAGEKVEDPSAVAKAPKFLKEFLKPTVCLKDICRAAIRTHLLRVSPVNLFIQVPQLGLPSLIEDYLLFRVSLGEEDRVSVPHVSRYGRTSQKPDRYTSAKYKK